MHDSAVMCMQGHGIVLKTSSYSRVSDVFFGEFCRDGWWK